MYYIPQERDVILVSLGAHEAWKVIGEEEQRFQTGVRKYLESKQALNTLSQAVLRDREQEVKNLLKQRPNSTSELLRLATLLEMKDNLSGAITKLEKILEINPSSDIYLRLGFLYECQGRYAEALRKYNERKAYLKEKIDSVAKPRPVLLLRQAPRGYRKLPKNHSYFLCCGVSSSAGAERLFVKGFDEKVNKNDDKLKLAVPSIIRLGFLEWIPIEPLEADGKYPHLGSISFERHTRLMERLKQYMDGYFGAFLS
jgi:tetratricopeptide (TPR) repeat protein